MPSEPSFETTTVGAQTWRYRDSGSGPAVVLFHGFPDTPQSWSGIANGLNGAGYRTIIPYLRGYHRDTIVAGRPYDALHLARDAVGLLDALELESAALIGHDWGATVVYAAAAFAPDRVRAIVPIAIPHPLTLKPKNALQAVGALLYARHFVYFQLPWAEAGTRRDNFRYIDTIYQRWGLDWSGPERDAAIARAKAAFADPEVLSGSIDYYRALTSKVDERLLRPIRCKGLMVAGGKDFGGHLGPYKKSRAFFEPGAELLVMPNGGHWPHREEESQFTDAVIRFLDQLPSKKRFLGS